MNTSQKTGKRVEKRAGQNRPGEFMRIDWEDDSAVEYVYGHVTLDHAKAAYERFGGIGCGEAVNGIKHRWARKCPTGANSEYEWMLHTYDTPSRGAFAVTELDVSTQLFHSLSGNLNALASTLNPLSRFMTHLQAVG